MQGWHGPVWRLAGPMILSNLTVPLMGMVDSAIMGHLPDPSLIGAVAVGALIFSFLFWGLGFLKMGTTGYAAQAFGAGDRAELAATLARPTLLALLLAAAILALQEPVARLSFWIVEPSQEVQANARLYYDIRIWSAPATLLTYGVVGWLIAVQDTRWVLVLALVTNLLNLGFSLFFVLALDWGIVGVAAGTVAAEYVALLTVLPVIAVKLSRHAARPTWARVLDRRAVIAMLRLNLDLLLRTFALLAAFTVFTSAGARQGDAILAANALLMHLQSLMAYGLDGFAHAAETLSGAAWGRRSRKDFVGGIEAATLWAAILSIGFAIAYAIAGPAILTLFTEHLDILEEASRYLPWMVVSPLVSIWSFMLDGVFVGTTRSAAMRNAMLLSLLVYLGLAWALVPGWGNHGLWVAFLGFMLARAATLGVLLPGLIRRLPAAS